MAAKLACMKLLMDRMLPISVCNKNADIRENHRPSCTKQELMDRDVGIVGAIKMVHVAMIKPWEELFLLVMNRVFCCSTLGSKTCKKRKACRCRKSERN